MEIKKQTVYLPEKVEGKSPEIRWNIIEDEGYFGDEWDNWEHLEEQERFEYFKKVFSHFKSIKDGEKQGYFFTPEQLNQYTSNVIEQTLEEAAEKANMLGETQHDNGAPDVQEDFVYVSNSNGPDYGYTVNKQSITNVFENVFNKFKV